MRSLVALLALASLAACSTQQAANIKDAATAPLSDLNLINAPIPDILLHAQHAPYAAPGDMQCGALLQEVHALDEVLGADLDTTPTEATPSLIERGNTLVMQQATNRLRSTTEALIPYRSWVRKLSGAERYSNQVAAAISAGTVRRAFLKGLAVATQCGKDS